MKLGHSRGNGCLYLLISVCFSLSLVTVVVVVHWEAMVEGAILVSHLAARGHTQAHACQWVIGSILLIVWFVLDVVSVVGKSHHGNMSGGYQVQALVVQMLPVWGDCNVVHVPSVKMSLGHQVMHVKVVTIEGVRPAGLVCRACRVEIVDIVWKLVGYGKEHGVGLLLSVVAMALDGSFLSISLFSSFSFSFLAFFFLALLTQRHLPAIMVMSIRIVPMRTIPQCRVAQTLGWKSIKLLLLWMSKFVPLLKLI